jgi:zinc protease
MSTSSVLKPRLATALRLRDCPCGSIATVSLAMLLAMAPKANAQNAPAAGALPTVQQVMDKYVAALGGRDAMHKHKSMTVHGSFDVSPSGPNLDRVAYYKSGKMLYQINLPKGSPYQEAYNGKIAWRVDPTDGAALFTGDELKSKERDADMYYPAHILDYFSSMEVVDVVDFEGHHCYHLKGTNKWGKVNEHFYDTATGLLVGYRFNSSWRGGAGNESEVFSDYKSFEGWLMPTRSTHKSSQSTQVETVTSVNFDDVNDSVFAVPQAVEALLSKRAH